MAKVIFAAAVYFLIVSACKGQGRPVAYRDTVFPAVTVEPDLSYRSSKLAGKMRKDYRFDMYMPGRGVARGYSRVHGSEVAADADSAAGRPMAGSGSVRRGFSLFGGGNQKTAWFPKVGEKIDEDGLAAFHRIKIF
jgi:hypothetical protein